jgi:hypothetical protein
VRARPQFSITLLILLTTPPIPAAAQDAASAKTFLQSAYRLYENGGKGTGLTSRYFHSNLLALADTDIKGNGPNNVPVVDFEPICGCQDWQGIWDLKIDVQVETPSRALADVSFALDPPKTRTRDSLRRLKITLVPERSQWRIYNVLDESDPAKPFDLRKELEKDIASLSKSPR